MRVIIGVFANKNKLKIEITKEGNWKVERNE